MKEITQKQAKKSPWSWIPTLYFAQGLPYVTVMSISVVMYKNLGLSNTEIALYTSWLYLPWVIKPFWSPFVDILKTKRWWTIMMQLFVTLALAGVAFTLPTSLYVKLSLAFFWVMGFCSATYDIAADGFYMLALDDSEQSLFVGIRSTFYRLATISGQGLLVILAGWLEKTTDNIPLAWSITFYILSGLFLVFFLYHNFILPQPISDKGKSVKTLSEVLHEFLITFKSFFTKKNIISALAFMLLFRLAEAFLVKLAMPFLLDDRTVGGLGLSTQQVGIAYGTVGVIALTLGGIIGGVVASRHGLKYWLWPMTLAITLPNAAYVFLSMTQTESFVWVNIAVAIEQFGYGFGFTAYMLYLIYFSQGEHKTAHYSICTGFMALGMMLPGMIAGWVQEQIGYQSFFILVMILTIPTFILIPFMKIDKLFGKSDKSK